MRTGIRIAVVALVIALLAALGVCIVRGVTGIVANVDMGGEPDPMFSEPPETVTRPPELDEEIPQAEHPTLDDYVPAEESPVDKTAAELIAEAKAAN